VNKCGYRETRETHEKNFTREQPAQRRLDWLSRAFSQWAPISILLSRIWRISRFKVRRSPVAVPALFGGYAHDLGFRVMAEIYQ
jgi:hypothetical protein